MQTRPEYHDSSLLPGGFDERLFQFHELDRNSIGSLDHGRAGVPPGVNILEDLDAFTLQPGEGRREIGDLKRPVIDDLSAWADESPARPRPDRDGDVVEEHSA